MQNLQRIVYWTVCGCPGNVDQEREFGLSLEVRSSRSLYCRPTTQAVFTIGWGTVYPRRNSNRGGYGLCHNNFKFRPAEQTRAPRATLEENIPWDNYEYPNNPFSAGIDCTAEAAEERKHLEKEADEFDMWHGADYLPEEDLLNGDLLLEELEQDDVLNEILRNASKYIP